MTKYKYYISNNMDITHITDITNKTNIIDIKVFLIPLI